ncbi:MAG: hypothetical protein ACKVZJ_09505 [Phycisphaerales bacterium]
MHTRSGTTSPFLEPPDAASYDALADLFLGAPTSAAEPTRAAPGPVSPRTPSVPVTAVAPAAPARSAEALTVEMLVMGHLPVRANPWAAQYARAVADRGTPVALLRVSAGEAMLDLFGVRPEQREHHHELTLESALQRARGFTNHWIIQCDEADPVAPMPLDRADLVTLLCAGNEAAVLAAFQSLKSLAGALEKRPRTLLQVGVMGAEPAEATSIAARLRQSADLFLKRRVDPAPSVGKMGPTGGAAVFRGPTSHSASELLDLAARAPTPKFPERETIPPAARQDPLPRATDLTAGQCERLPAPVTAEPLRNISTDPNPGPSHGVSTSKGSLAHRLPNLTSLPFRCPDAPTVEFARDEHATLHLLLSSEGPEALHAITSAHAWAAKNAELLRLVAPGLDADAAALHLFTSSPKRLRPLLDSRIRVHLLAGVEVEGKAGWYCVELN